MLLSYNWIKEYIDPELDAETLAEELTLLGLEVTDIQAVNQPIQGLKIGEVIKKWKHPNADRLNLTHIRYFDNGKEQVDQVVCGAANIAEGQKIILATVGTVLAPDFIIKKAKIRGEESCGMVCSRAELGKEVASEGIWVLPPQTSLEDNPQSFLGKPDHIFDFDLTSNRSDTSSALGIAREVAILTKKNITFFRNGSFALNEPQFLNSKNIIDLPKETDYQITIADPNDCYRYQGILIDNITVAESPLWLQERLHNHGLRSISNMVDITNLILREYGQPIHAFDADKIGKHISTRRAKSGEVLTILNGTTLKLSSKDLVIADEHRPIAMAGIMGGLNTGVTDTTKRVFLEVAVFDPLLIRTTLKRHQLNSDAGKYFQNQVNPNFANEVLRIAAQAMALLGKGTINKQAIDVFSKANEFLPKEISLSLSQLNKALGFKLTHSEVVAIFKRLLFEVVDEKTNEFVLVRIPNHRFDINYEWDLIEEIARVYGYNNIPESYPRITNAFGPLQKAKERKQDQVVEDLRWFCLSLGFHEILTYPFVEDQFAELLNKNEDNYLKPINPVLNDVSLLRNNLLFGFLKTIGHNLENKVSGFDHIFEIGKVFNSFNKNGRDNKNNQEHEHPSKFESSRLALALWEVEVSKHWKFTPPTVGYSDMSGAVEAILAKLFGNVNEIEFIPVAQKKQSQIIQQEGDNASNLIIASEKIFTSSTFTQIVYHDTIIGEFGMISSPVKEYFGINTANIDRKVLYAELALEKIYQQLKLNPIQFHPYSIYPAVRRDIALVLDKSISIMNIKKTMLTLSSLIVQVNISDIYPGEDTSSIPVGKHSVVFSLEFVALDKTLQRKEVDDIVLQMVEKLKKIYNFTLR